MSAKFCSKCGEKVSGEYKFCKKCGNPLGTAGDVPASVNRTPVSGGYAEPNISLDDEKTVLQTEPMGVPTDRPKRETPVNPVPDFAGTGAGRPVNPINSANPVPPNGGAMNRPPVMPQPMNNGVNNHANNNGGLAKKIITVLIIILLLIAIGGAGYFTVNAIINSSQNDDRNNRSDRDEEDEDQNDGNKDAEPDKENELYADAVADPSKHRYELVIGDITWTEAEKTAREKGGYLACITSKEEEEEIIDYVSKEEADLRVVFIGANNLDGAYKWVTGEAFSYEDWCPGEPNNGNNEENYVALYVADTGWGWNDTPDDMYQKYDGQFTGKCGYLIEYNE